MNIYHISQTENKGYDTYSDLVVAAENEEEARLIHPSNWYKDDPWNRELFSYGEWATKPENVKVEYLGEAKEGTEAGIICSSFHAG